MEEVNSVLLHSWGIQNNVTGLITHNVPNMIACAQVRQMPCFAHKLNFVVKKGIEQTPELHARLQSGQIMGFFQSRDTAK